VWIIPETKRIGEKSPQHRQGAGPPRPPAHPSSLHMHAPGLCMQQVLRRQVLWRQLLHPLFATSHSLKTPPSAYTPPAELAGAMKSQGHEGPGTPVVREPGLGMGPEQSSSGVAGRDSLQTLQRKWRLRGTAHSLKQHASWGSHGVGVAPGAANAQLADKPPSRPCEVWKARDPRMPMSGRGGCTCFVRGSAYGGPSRTGGVGIWCLGHQNTQHC
jgi:hypothetical protein